MHRLFNRASFIWSRATKKCNVPGKIASCNQQRETYSLGTRKYSNAPPQRPFENNSYEKNNKWNNFYDQFVKDFKDLSNEMEKRRYNTRWIYFIGVGVFGYATYGFFRNWASKEVVLISSKTFEDPKFKDDAIKFVKYLANSDQVQTEINNLIEKITTQQVVQDNLAALFENVLQKNSVKDSAKTASQDIVRDLCNSPEYELWRKDVSEYLKKEIQTQLSDDKNREAINNMTKQTIRSLFWK